MINEKKVKSYCCEDISLIENYDKAMTDKTQTWDCHHRAEILPCGRFSRGDLKKHGLYWGVPASQLVFMSQNEHLSLHMKGVPKTESMKHKLSKSRKGKHLSEEHRRKISKSMKGMTSHNKGKHLSEETRNRISSAMSGENNHNFGKKLSEETRKRISDAKKRYWESRRAVS